MNCKYQFVIYFQIFSVMPGFRKVPPAHHTSHDPLFICLQILRAANQFSTPLEEYQTAV